jgi:hypothetical protein
MARYFDYDTPDLPIRAFRTLGGKLLTLEGKGGAPDTSGQNEAARINAEIAKDMWGQYKETYLPKEQQFATEAFNYDTPEKRDQQAAFANADVSSSFANQRDQSARNLASMGVDPSSGAWANQDSKMRMAQAAAGAGAQNAARLNVENMGFARKQDAISIGKGMPGTASASAAQAGATYGQSAQNQAAQNKVDSANIGSAVQGGIGVANNWDKVKSIFAKDGGLITKNEQHLAAGGVVSNPRMKQIMDNNAASANVTAPNGTDPTGQLLDDAQLAKKGYDLYQHLNAAPNYYAAMTPTATNAVAAPIFEQSASAIAPDIAAAVATDAAAAGTTAGTAAATAAGTAAAGGAAAGTAASGAASTIGTAVPVVGAALLAARLLGIFDADGGAISKDDPRLGKRKDIRNGGEIEGAGTETSDDVPLMGSDGEYMLNAETVKMIGKKKLDALNAAGLAKRYGVKGRAA